MPPATSAVTEYMTTVGSTRGKLVLFQLLEHPAHDFILPAGVAQENRLAVLQAPSVNVADRPFTGLARPSGGMEISKACRRPPLDSVRAAASSPCGAWRRSRPAQPWATGMDSFTGNATIAGPIGSICPDAATRRTLACWFH